MRRAIRAFTFVELLLAVSIIAVLISLLLPALAMARRAAHDAVCASNLKQHALAWTLYTDDFGLFPWGQGEYRVRFGWGGVHWYGLDRSGEPIIPDDGPALNLLTAVRPVNPYLGRDETTQAFERVFRCPADDGLRIPGAAKFGLNDDPWHDLGPGNLSGEGDQTVFGKVGTSYEANTSMYERVIDGDPVYGPFFGPKDVFVSPSRFVLVGDAGAMTIARGGLYQDVVVQGWWHGFGRGQMAFLDGSARHERVVGDSLGYTFQRLP
jgi:hypothetical protein